MALGPPHPSPDLVELRKAKAVCMLHHHHPRPRDIHSHLHHRRGHQDLNLSLAEGVHYPSLFLCPHPPVETADSAVLKDPPLELSSQTGRRLQIGLLILFHEWTDDVGASPFSDFLQDKPVGLKTHPLG